MTTTRTERVCSKCGVSKPHKEFHRYTAYRDGLRPDCKACRFIVAKIWRDANPEEHRARAQAFAVANPESRRRSDHKWKAANVAQAREQCSKWGKANPDKVAALAAKRRARLARAIPAWADAAAIAATYAGAARWGWTVDHVVPVRSPLVCGLHVHANLQAIESSLNTAKGNRSWPDMPGA